MYTGRPDLDVCLYDGEGYMVAEKPYQEYLTKVPSKKEVSYASLPSTPFFLISVISVTEIYMPKS